MGSALAELCTDDATVRSLVVDAYLASYATIGQVAMIGAENRLGTSSAGRIRAIRATAAVPDVPMRILTATRGKPPIMQRRAEELAAQTAAGFRLGRHIVVPDSGHCIHKDQPAAVIAAIEEAARLS